MRHNYIGLGKHAMKSQFMCPLIAILTLAGCAEPNTPIKINAGDLTQVQVDAIVEHCGAAAGLVSVQDALLTINRSSELAVTGCVLDALYATGETSLTTVGNQRYEASNR